MMWEFFRPFRRKIGAITLVMACVFTVGWIRSERETEEFVIGSGPVAYSQVYSNGGEFGFGMHARKYGDIHSWLWVHRLIPAEPSDSPPYFTGDDGPVDWRGKLLGFECVLYHYHNEQYDPKIGCQYGLKFLAPYWGMTLPLVLLSAYLLLSRPLQKSKPDAAAGLETAGE